MGSEVDVEALERVARGGKVVLKDGDLAALLERLRAAEAERDAMRWHYDAAAPEHNLLALFDLYIARAEQAERERDEARAALAQVRAQIDTMLVTHDEVERRAEAAEARVAELEDADKAWALVEQEHGVDARTAVTQHHDLRARLAVLERVAEAALAWWGSKRPVSWSDAEHRASPRVNCTTIGEDMLADACAALAARGKDGR